MGYEPNLGELVEQIKAASANIVAGDAAMNGRIDAVERAVDELFRKAGRPFGGELDDSDQRKSAIEMCKVRHAERVPKDDGVTKAYSPSSVEIDEALAARRAFSHVIRHGDASKLDAFEQKSLSAFSFAGTGMLLPPERMQEVLSCIVYPSSLGALFGSITTSAPAVEFLIENPRMGLGAWSCESSCFANNPQPDLAEGMGVLTIKPETIRFIACATRDFLEDSANNAEAWVMRKISDGMAATINNALLIGDGVGKPMGVLNPRSGIPICETAAATAAGSLTWQDAFMLKWEVPEQWQAGGSYLCNQRTWAQLMTMTDASGRPIWSQPPGAEPGYFLAGSPVHIATQMPDIMPGSTPLAFGNWKQAYSVVWRKAVTVQVDPYSANFCVLFKAEARVGGGSTCPNAARLLRIR